jgi:replicative DNA helicase
MGKTALALGFAQTAAASGMGGVAIFSLEMSVLQLGMRLVASSGKIDPLRLRTGWLSSASGENGDDWTRLGRAAGLLGELPLFICDRLDITILDMKAALRRLLLREKQLAMVVVDYLQLVASHGRHESRNLELGVMTRQLKGIAKDFQVPVICLSQMSREIERRSEKRPNLADLRDSGSIEADADMVIFPHRPKYFERGESEEAPSGVEEAELIISKQRNGPIGTVRCGFHARFAQFVNLDAHHGDEHAPPPGWS